MLNTFLRKCKCQIRRHNWLFISEFIACLLVPLYVYRNISSFYPYYLINFNWKIRYCPSFFSLSFLFLLFVVLLSLPLVTHTWLPAFPIFIKQKICFPAPFVSGLRNPHCFPFCCFSSQGSRAVIATHWKNLFALCMKGT